MGLSKNYFLRMTRNEWREKEVAPKREEHFRAMAAIQTPEFKAASEARYALLESINSEIDAQFPNRHAMSLA